MPSNTSLRTPTPKKRRVSTFDRSIMDWTAPGLSAGVDEAGRGPLAGPVVAAAVMLDPRLPLIEGLADSKKISARKREALFDAICAQALCCSVAQASVAEIDQFNILQATWLAMQRAVAGLRLPPQRVWVDGNRAPQLGVPAHTVVGGDARVPAIAAASILAKVTRDRCLVELDRAYPHYGFAQHKGYPTPEHLQALRQWGPSAVHRRSFAPVAASVQWGIGQGGGHVVG